METFLHVAFGDCYRAGSRVHNGDAAESCTRVIQNVGRLAAGILGAVGAGFCFYKGGGLLLTAAEKGIKPLIVGAISVGVGVCTLPWGIPVIIAGVTIATLLSLPAIIYGVGAVVAGGAGCLAGLHAFKALSNIKQ